MILRRNLKPRRIIISHTEFMNMILSFNFLNVKNFLIQDYDFNLNNARFESCLKCTSPGPLHVFSELRSLPLSIKINNHVQLLLMIFISNKK